MAYQIIVASNASNASADAAPSANTAPKKRKKGDLDDYFSPKA